MSHSAWLAFAWEIWDLFFIKKKKKEKEKERKKTNNNKNTQKKILGAGDLTPGKILTAGSAVTSNDCSSCGGPESSSQRKRPLARVSDGAVIPGGSVGGSWWIDTFKSALLQGWAFVHYKGQHLMRRRWRVRQAVSRKYHKWRCEVMEETSRSVVDHLSP